MVLPIFNWTRTHNVAEVSQTDYDNYTTNNPLSIQQSSPANFTLTTSGSPCPICTVPTH
ncbi:hypothetical protein SLEP1_g13348 [Rubroshorea leprosula]|uniref:Phytocyanin domain-containing protein n=1 Tax=Rubroshorea leprosula TaxID=152421 RepID=A0AAV5IQY9_9ROSI|nr:hypothetical protein SLEP1_g13348 [Rubroshorea leprosula]